MRLNARLYSLLKHLNAAGVVTIQHVQTRRNDCDRINKRELTRPTSTMTKTMHGLDTNTSKYTHAMIFEVCNNDLTASGHSYVKVACAN